jgi:hypothetical protein
VIAASSSSEATTHCLHALGEATDVELIVAARVEIPRPSPIDPAVTWITARSDASVHDLRGLGLCHARAPIVAFTEDSTVPAPGWATAWLEAFSTRSQNCPSASTVATGAVVPSPQASRLDLAVFLCEYVPFLPPLDAGMGGRLAGNNFAATLAALTDCVRTGELHEWMLYGDPSLITAPQARCVYVGRHTLSGALNDRLRRGYQFGHQRAHHASKTRRYVMAALGAGIWFSQLGRLLKTLALKRGLSSELLASLPWTTVLLAAWSLGEWAGWLSASFRPRASSAHGTTARFEARSPARRASRRRHYKGVRSSA